MFLQIQINMHPSRYRPLSPFSHIYGFIIRVQRCNTKAEIGPKTCMESGSFLQLLALNDNLRLSTKKINRVPGTALVASTRL